MKKNFIISLAFLLIQINVIAETGHKIELKFKGIKDSSFIFGHYFDTKMFVDDTISINKNGVGFIKGSHLLPEGIYLVYFSDSCYFDFLIGKDQNLSIEITNLNEFDKIKISGSEESQKYKYYQKLLDGMYKEKVEINNKLKQTSGTKDSIKLNNKLNEINSNILRYYNQIINENKGTFLSSFFKALKEINIPDFEIDENVIDKESALQRKRYNYYKEHYLDNLDLSDKRLLYTPFFSRKIDYYIKNVIVQNPDSLIKEGIKLIESTRSDSTMFMFMTQRMYNFAQNSKIMGMDALLSAIGKKYYLSGEATWADEKFLKDLKEHIYRIEPTLLGKTAHDLKMESYTGEHFKLSEIRAPYTVVVFWETSCGHCKKQIPSLKTNIEKYINNFGIKVFAVYTQQEKEPWEEFIENHDLYDWVNVYDPYNVSNFRYYYNIQTTPIIFILDRDKKIVAKKIGIDDIAGFFDHEINYGRL